MDALIDIVLSSTGVVAALVLAALWSVLRPASRAARRFLVAVAAAYTLCSIYAIPYAIGQVTLVRGWRPLTSADIPAGRTVIVVLGGGAETARGWDQTPLSVPSGDGLERVIEAARVRRMAGSARVISSGGALNPRQEPNGLIMRDALVRLGVPSADILVEATSRTTREEAVRVTPLLRSMGAEHVILVTSSTHMRRAMGAFRAAGIAAIPAIAPEVDFRQPLISWIAPSGRGLAMSRQVAHEMAGLAYYAFKGWWTRPA